MTNRPYDRTVINPLEKPLADDINQAETNFDHMMRFFSAALFRSADGVNVDGFLANGFKVVAKSVPDLSVQVKAGLGFQDQVTTEIAIGGIIGLNDLEKCKPIPLLSDLEFAVPASPAAPNTRIDIIEVRADRLLTDPSARQVFSEGLGQFIPGTVLKTLQWALDERAGFANAPANSTQPLSYKIGVEGNPGAAPVVTGGYIKIAEILVGSDVVLIDDANITDFRADISLNNTTSQDHEARLVDLEVQTARRRVPLERVGAIGTGLVTAVPYFVSFQATAAAIALWTIPLASGERLTAVFVQIVSKSGIGTIIHL